ncbi:LamG-like jellyroll fold domain-containing protein [Sphaerisporangium flaviroseum]|uniref:LamG-like jellyroll fold domain-containing protein n=1 Tax=Sphaerisporangium flaviroseum TaxID=509199 RepID=UPI0031E8CCC6
MAGLVAAYGMNEGSGTTVADSSGQSNTGAARDTTWTTGKYGKALSFNGSSSWVTIQHAALLRLTNALTLSAWVRPSALDDLWRSVLMKENAEGGSYGLYVSSEYTARSGWLQTTEEGGGIVGSGPLPQNQWSHLAFSYAGGTARLYVNGTQVAQVPVAGDALDDGGVRRIDGNAFWGEFYSGLIDEVRVYNRAQSLAEIQTDMNTPIGATGTSTAQRLNAHRAGKNRYSSCYWGYWRYYNFDTKGNEIGYILFRYTTNGALFPERRSFVYGVYLDVFSTDGIVSGLWTRRMRIGISAYTGESDPGGSINSRVTRTADQNMNDRNDSRARRMCKKIWGKDYVTEYAVRYKDPATGALGPDWNCDEFPFKSTREGAAYKIPDPAKPGKKKFANNYSVWLLPKDENQEFGTAILNVFYDNDHVIDGDTFWIRIA